MFSFSLLFLINSISNIKQSSLPWHLLMTFKCLIKLSRFKACSTLKCFPIMFFYALMEVAASVPNISCIAQISCEFIYYTLQILLHTQITCEFTYCTSQMLLIKNSLFTLSQHCLQSIDVFFLLVVILGFMGHGL